MASAPRPALRIRSVVFDCADPAALAGFYGALLDGRVDTTDPEWCEVHLDGAGPKLAFQLVPGHQPPEWPDGVPQQLHLDLDVEDLAATTERALSLGARQLHDPIDETNCTFVVFADPSGHPFCLCREVQA